MFWILLLSFLKASSALQLIVARNWLDPAVHVGIAR